jgi:hypothetical protein
VTPEELVEFSEALARIAASGGGPKALVAQLARTTGCGALLEDAQWRHLAAAGEKGTPASGRAIVESGADGRAQQVTAGNRHLGWLSLFGSNSGIETDLLLRLTGAAVAVELARDASGLRERKGIFGRRCSSGAFTMRRRLVKKPPLAALRSHPTI